MDQQTLDAIVRELRAIGTDSASVEVKDASGGLPKSLVSTLCALSNTPGGGVIILGLSEHTGFLPSGLTSQQVTTLSQGVAQQSRLLQPAPPLDFLAHAEVEGVPVVAVQVGECPSEDKPCKLPNGTAYNRSFDGDYALSDVDKQAYLSARSSPRADESAVDGTSLDDLNTELLTGWVEHVKAVDPNGLGRFDGVELLQRAGIVTGDGNVTLAAYLALADHPQTIRPRFTIRAAWQPRSSDVREMTFTGPIPSMMEQSLQWAQDVLPTVVRRSGGLVHDSPLYPMSALRELLSNALIHRDLNPWSHGRGVELRLSEEKLVVTSPGGLYGVTVDTLTRTSVSTTRNSRLVALCQHVRMPRQEGRVVEALATGIPTVLSSVKSVGFPPPTFVDTGIQFSAIIHTSRRPRKSVSKTQRLILDLVEGGNNTIALLEPQLDVSNAAIRKAVRELVRDGHLSQEGGRGRVTTYRVNHN